MKGYMYKVGMYFDPIYDDVMHGYFNVLKKPVEIIDKINKLGFAEKINYNAKSEIVSRVKALEGYLLSHAINDMSRVISTWIEKEVRPDDVVLMLYLIGVGENVGREEILRRMDEFGKKIKKIYRIRISSWVLNDVSFYPLFNYVLKAKYSSRFVRKVFRDIMGEDEVDVEDYMKDVLYLNSFYRHKYFEELYWGVNDEDEYKIIDEWLKNFRVSYDKKKKTVVVYIDLCGKKQVLGEWSGSCKLGDGIDAVVEKEKKIGGSKCYFIGFDCNGRFRIEGFCRHPKLGYADHVDEYSYDEFELMAKRYKGSCLRGLFKEKAREYGYKYPMDFVEEKYSAVKRILETENIIVDKAIAFGGERFLAIEKHTGCSAFASGKKGALYKLVFECEVSDDVVRDVAKITGVDEKFLKKLVKMTDRESNVVYDLDYLGKVMFVDPKKDMKIGVYYEICEKVEECKFIGVRGKEVIDGVLYYILPFDIVYLEKFLRLLDQVELSDYPSDPVIVLVPCEIDDGLYYYYVKGDVFYRVWKMVGVPDRILSGTLNEMYFVKNDIGVKIDLERAI